MYGWGLTIIDERIFVCIRDDFKPLWQTFWNTYLHEAEPLAKPAFVVGERFYTLGSMISE